MHFDPQHHYGPRVHLSTSGTLPTYLADLCSPDTKQPRVNDLVERIYAGLLEAALDELFPRVKVERPTRMATAHPREGIYRGEILDPKIRAVTVNLARAGTLPSAVCYQTLNTLLNPDLVRQDHISIARQTGADHRVIGSAVTGHKIGGKIDGAVLVIPDPMAATGSTIVETLELYRAYGRPLRTIALHCIVTPEYLRKVTHSFPELEIYAVRLDRGLSSPDVLNSPLGSRWEEEKGLNAQQYIVPGGGGLGEVLNNSYV